MLTFGNRRARSAISRAVNATLYAAGEDKDKAKGGAGEDEGGDDEVKMTKAELDKMLADAKSEAEEETLRAERERRKQAEKEKRQRERRERGEDEEEEDPAEIVRRAEDRAAKAEQEAAAAKRESQLEKVGNRLRDYLTANYKEFFGNAVDIMPHIEKALAPDATDQAITRLVESHTKAFVERTKQSKGAHGAPAGGATRGKPTSAVGVAPVEDRGMKPEPTSARRPFSTINWHG